MKKTQILIKRKTTIMEEAMYEVEIPKDLEENSIEEYVKNFNPKLTPIGVPQPQKIEEETKITTTKEETTYIKKEQEQKGTTKEKPTAKAILNNALMKKDYEQFKWLFLTKKEELRPNDYYLLLYNILNTQQIELAVLLFSKEHNVLTEKHIVKLLSTVGVIQSKPIVQIYIELGYHKIDIEGHSLKELYERRGRKDLLDLFEVN